ncbi:MAG: Organic hydroperoxide resistance protein, partial [uncultured Thermomicrobiales bacterium]
GSGTDTIEKGAGGAAGRRGLGGRRPGRQRPRLRRHQRHLRRPPSLPAHPRRRGLWQHEPGRVAGRVPRQLLRDGLLPRPDGCGQPAAATQRQCQRRARPEGRRRPRGQLLPPDRDRDGPRPRPGRLRRGGPPGGAKLPDLQRHPGQCRDPVGGDAGL